MNSLSLSAEDKEQSLISEITAIGNVLRLLDHGSPWVPGICSASSSDEEND